MNANHESDQTAKRSKVGRAKRHAWFFSLRPDLRIALVYAAFGGLWILFSDRLLAALVTDLAALTLLQTYKGWAFVAASALVIFLLLRRELNLLTATERRLNKSEERFRATLDTMLEGCQIIGFDWRYLYVNDAVVAQSGYRRDELLGHTMMEKYPGIDLLLLVI